MKRSPLNRKTPLARGKPLDRGSKPLKRTPLARGKNGLARSNLKPQSERRKAERGRREAVRAATIRRAGGECQAAGIVPEIACWGPLDVDEVIGRGVKPGGHLDETNTQALCRAHHSWKHENPAEARRRGLRRESWE